MTYEQAKTERNLLRVLLLSQLLVYSIDEVENDNRFWQHDIKRMCKQLSDTIIKKHGIHIAKIFEANNGEFIQDLNRIIESLVTNLCEMDLTQYGAMLEISQVILENPHATMAEDEKDKLIVLMKNELSKAANGIEEGEIKVDNLHTKLSKMTAIGQTPYNIISSELIEIKRYLRLIRTGNNETSKLSDVPRP